MEGMFVEEVVDEVEREDGGGESVVFFLGVVKGMSDEVVMVFFVSNDVVWS